MNQKRPFYGRTEELRILDEEFTKNTSSMVVIRGRRRIGKSRLIEEFSKRTRHIHFSGLPPTRLTTNQNQRKEFANQMAEALQFPSFEANDWSQLFNFLAREVSSGKWLIVFDEISWMGSKDPDFLGKLKNAWDLHFSKNPELMLILCGSVSSWIEKNILGSTGFLGRVSIDLVIEELPLKDCLEFWRNNKEKVSPYEIFKVLGVTGGIPKYLEEIRPELSAEENIQRLCFKPRGLLFREFEQIFSDLFSKRSEKYKQILSQLIYGSKTPGEIVSFLKLSKGGHLSNYLFELEEAGFICSDWTWNIKTHKVSNLKKYRLSDNYLRFYLKYVAPKKKVIEKGKLELEPIVALDNFAAVMGYQFENLVIANCGALYQALGIHLADVLIANPYFQRKTNRVGGCQIDFMIQTRHRVLYLVEIKFSGSLVGKGVIEEMKKKVNVISLPRGMSIRTCLVHVNGVSEDVKDECYFDFIIDFADLFFVN